jgi:hypothetical protein
MQPTLHSGDVIVVEAVARPRRGEILTFAQGDGRAVVTHRVLCVGSDTVTCRGDNREHSDPPVPVAAIIGAAHQTIDGRSLPALDPGWFLAGLRGRRLLMRPWRLLSELRLLGRQFAEPRRGAVGGGETGTGGGSDLNGQNPAVAGETGSLPAGTVAGDGRLVLPAGCYSRRPVQQRGALLAALPPGPVTIYAYPLEAGGRRVLVTAHVRRCLRVFGMACGQPGDLTLPRSGEETSDGFGPRPFAHSFTVGELAGELGAAGADGVEIELEPVGRQMLLRARFTMPEPGVRLLSAT